MLTACYDAHGTRVELRTPASQHNCTETADQVFAKEGFTSYTNVYGAHRFYSPKAPGELALGWGSP
jgi:hypothetical protein